MKTTTQKRNDTVLYWTALTAMFASFISVVLL